MIENEHLNNAFDLSVEEENYKKIDNKAYAEFKEQLKSEPRLYQRTNTYYIRMKYSEDNTKALYNRIKNELMSYVDRYDTENRVKSKLCEHGEEFYIGNIIAQLRVVGGTLSLYLALDPAKYSTSDAFHKDVSSDPEFAETPFLLRLTKESRVTKAMTAICDAMTAAGCVKDTTYPWLDYASYYSRQTLVAKRLTTVVKEDATIKEGDLLNVACGQNEKTAQEATDTNNNESPIIGTMPNTETAEGDLERVIISDITDIHSDDILEIIEEKEIGVNDESFESKFVADTTATDVAEELIAETSDEATAFEDDKPVYVYENIASPTNRPVFRDLKNIDKPVVEGSHTPLRNTIFDTPEEKTKERAQVKQTKNPIAKQVEVWNEIEDYGYHFVPIKQLAFYGVAIALAIVMGIIYKLNAFFIAILILASLLLMPGAISAYYRKKYEEKRFRDAEAYIEQMLYSFRRNSKIVASLHDALVVFPSGHMHDKIIEAMDYIRNSGDDPNIYANALAIIEDAYPCRRIKSLHRYMIKVEDVGGKHEAGIQALLRDRRLWTDRMDHFRKECSEIVKEIFISGIFSLGMACLILYMMPSDLYDLSTSMLYQIITTIFAIINLAVIQITYRTTVIRLDDDEDVAHSQQIAKKLEWYRNCDPEVERQKAIKPAIIIGLVGVVGLILGQTLTVVLSAVVVVYLLVLKTPMDRSSAKKAICREVEKSYPDWLLELALLLQTAIFPRMCLGRRVLPKQSETAE